MATQSDIRAPLHDSKATHGEAVRYIQPKSIPFVERDPNAGNY
ncbi:MAG: hypothetical protein RBT75_19585 [Anaerolineae bacterium]|jgi:hypothetical protein|nr:hypothetical protein [Anaerolineae bacterium]